MSGIKVLHTADWHLGKRLQEYSRLEEQVEVLDEICAIADTQQVDMIFVAGDLFDVFHPSHESQDLLYKTLFRLSAHGKRPVIAIAGNHDSHALIEAPLPLAKELGILLLGANHQPMERISLLSDVEVSIPEHGVVLIDFKSKQETAAVIIAPYANEQLLRVYLGETQREEELRDILRTKWAQLAQSYFTNVNHRFFIGHFFFMQEGGVAEKEPESERSILYVGGAQAQFTDHLPDGLDYAALGHLHRFHSIDERRFPVVYAGSPLAYSFSEAGQDKCIVLFESQTKSYRSISLKKGFDLERKRFENTEEALLWLEQHSDVYVELTLVSDGALDSQTRRAIHRIHDKVVHLIPEFRSSQVSNTIASRSIEQDIETLFVRYVENEKGAAPSETMIELFREILGKEGGL